MNNTIKIHNKMNNQTSLNFQMSMNRFYTLILQVGIPLIIVKVE